MALLDGPMVDDGTAWEAGFAYARGLPIYGVRTDFRRAGETPASLVNCMVECACERLFSSRADCLAWLGKHVTTHKQ